VNEHQDFEALMQRMADDINGNAESYGVGTITASQVASAIESLESDGYAFDSVLAREELIARRIIRINPSSNA
jgi:hypothetical protein